MPRIALTGGIATGKSVVGRALREAGILTVDADVLARAVVGPGTPGLAGMVARFGPGVLTADGQLDRQAVARIVFADAAARRDLERIIHPLVRAGVEAFLATLPAGAVGVAEIPLLYETGWVTAFDVVVVTACRPATQLARVMARDHLSAEAAAARLAAQWPIEDKARLGDAVVVTDGEMAGTLAQAAGLARWLRGRSNPS